LPLSCPVNRSEWRDAAWWKNMIYGRPQWPLLLMLYLLQIIKLIALSSFGSVAHAGKCDNMPEGDNKSLCAAIDQKAPRFCDLITNSDSRHSCVARVQINSYACDNIKSIRLRAECLYQVRKDQANSIYSYSSGKKI